MYLSAFLNYSLYEASLQHLFLNNVTERQMGVAWGQLLSVMQILKYCDSAKTQSCKREDLTTYIA